MLLVCAFWCPSHYPTVNAISTISCESTVLSKDTTNVHPLLLVLSTAYFKTPAPQFEQFALEITSENEIRLLL